MKLSITQPERLSPSLNLLPRGRRWIQSRLTLLVLLGFIHGLLFWDGDILLAYGLVGLICWRLVRDAPSVKSLFNTCHGSGTDMICRPLLIVVIINAPIIRKKSIQQHG